MILLGSVSFVQNSPVALLTDHSSKVVTKNTIIVNFILKRLRILIMVTNIYIELILLLLFQMLYCHDHDQLSVNNIIIPYLHMLQPDYFNSESPLFNNVYRENQLIEECVGSSNNNNISHKIQYVHMIHHQQPDHLNSKNAMLIYSNRYLPCNESTINTNSYQYETPNKIPHIHHLHVITDGDCKYFVNGLHNDVYNDNSSQLSV